MADPTPNPTQILGQLGAGDRSAAGRLLPLIYDELRAIAAAELKNERAGHTLQPTALVNEAYLRLVDIERVNWKGRAHFLAMGAEAIRRVLVDHARARAAVKRGGSGGRGRVPDARTAHRVTLAGADGVGGSEGLDVLALDDALKKLAERDARQARVVELRFFGGLSPEHVGELLGVSARTVEGDWRIARAWLKRELDGRGE